MLPAVLPTVSQICKPEIVAELENGPNVIAAVFDALPAGEAAAANVTACRLAPEPTASSLPEVDDGTPSDRPTDHPAGLVGATVVRHQSSRTFSKYAETPAIVGFSFV